MLHITLPRLPQAPYLRRTSKRDTAPVLRQGVCLAAGAAAGAVFLGARLPQQGRRRPMPHRQTFQHALESLYGAAGAAVLAARAQARYSDLYAARPRFAHPALRWHLTYQILPGLALYQTLRDHAAEQGAPPASALMETGQAIDHMDVLAPALRFLRRFPFSFALFRRIGKLSLVLFPAKGWDIQMVEDSQQRFAFNISRCFYLDVLRAYGAPELTAHFCRLDDIAYAELPPQVRWERTTTLGRGGPNCDFCWRAGTRAAG